MKKEVKLTEYSHGAGCGCKIAPKVLESILESSREQIKDPRLLVGNSSKDDSAAYDLGNGTSVLSTTDFFMPIVNDPFTFGRIAATNAISDIYAMGGRPLMAISIFGWPIDLLSEEVAREVIDGGRSACEEAGINLAGGHSIDSPEPIFGLSVTGIVENEYLKQNDKAEKDCEIFLTKPLGIGILSTAQKKNKIENNDIDIAVETMCKLNKIGMEIAKLDGVVALTDVTGFGFLGHLLEICESSNISAEIDYSRVPVLPNTRKYMEMGCIPGGTKNNFKNYGDKIDEMTKEQQILLCDAQTSGGLLAVVKRKEVDKFKEIVNNAGYELESLGKTKKPRDDDKFIKVI